MKLRTEIEKIERAIVAKEFCPYCAFDAGTPGEPALPIPGICPICGGPVVYDGAELSEKERYVLSEIAKVRAFDVMTDRLRIAMSYWWQGRSNVSERDEQETRLLQARASFDPDARQRLTWKKACEEHAKIQQESFIKAATDEQLIALDEIGSMSDEELESIIWSEQIAA